MTNFKKAIHKTVGDYEPIFYYLSGSHLYDIDSERSDYDVRGVHLMDVRKHLEMHTPRFEVKRDIHGDEHYDVKSIELKKFGKELFKMNFNVIEGTLYGKQLINKIPKHISSLRGIIRDYLPGRVPHAYYGMAKGNYMKYLEDPTRDTYNPKPKKFLYVIRGLLGAIYVVRRKEIEPKVKCLSQKVRVDVETEDMVSNLVSVKRSDETLSNREMDVYHEKLVDYLR